MSATDVFGGMQNRDQEAEWRPPQEDEMDYFTDLALQEAQRWIETVTRKRFEYPDDPRRSMENGILLCELLNCLRPTTVRKINRLPTPIAGLDNINVFLEACQTRFGLKDSQLFHSCDLEDLSTRAVSDSEELLRRETDRRLRNVAITIFWLGRVAHKKRYQIPQLDFTAFSDLVGQSQWSLRSPPQTPSLASSVATSVENLPALAAAGDYGRQESGSDFGSVGRSSAYGSLHSERKHSASSAEEEASRLLNPPQVKGQGSGHRRDGSYESFYSDQSATSLEGRGAAHAAGQLNPEVGRPEAAMPVRHNGYQKQQSGAPPTGATSAGDLRYSASMDTYYDDRKQLASAASAQGPADPSGRHDNGEAAGGPPGAGRPTQYRRISTIGPPEPAKPTADPLQFIKVEGSALSAQAQELVEKMERQKKEKKTAEVESEDWHSWRENLSNWKSKMRRKSSHQRPDDELDDEQEVTQRAKAKTFKEMVEERERRKSGSFNTYPSADDAEDHPAPLPTRVKAAFVPDTTRDEDKLGVFGFHVVQDAGPRGVGASGGGSPSPRRPQPQERGAAAEVGSAPRAARQRPSLTAPTPAAPTPAAPAAPEHFRGGSRTYGFAARFESGQPGVSSVVSPPPSRAETWRATRLAPRSPGGAGVSASMDSPGGAATSGQRRQLSYDHDRLERITSPRSKGGYRAWSWERKSESKSEEGEPEQEVIAPWAQDDVDSVPSQGQKVAHVTPQYHKPDINSNRHDVSDKATTPTPTTTTTTPRGGTDHTQGFQSSRKVFENSSVVEERNNASSPGSRDVGGRRSGFTRDGVHQWEDSVVTKTTMTSSRSYSQYERSGTGDRDGWRREEERKEERVTSEVSRPSESSPPPSPLTPIRIDPGNFIEKTVKINQNPNNEKGFGFTIKGGREPGAPITVEKVILGSKPRDHHTSATKTFGKGGAADVCELMPGDQILAINGEEVATHYLDSVQYVINQAVKTGQIELRVRRSFDKAKMGLIDAEEEMQLERERKLHNLNTSRSTPTARGRPDNEVDEDRDTGRDQTDFRSSEAPISKSDGQRVDVTSSSPAPEADVTSLGGADTTEAEVRLEQEIIAQFEKETAEENKEEEEEQNKQKEIGGRVKSAKEPSPLLGDLVHEETLYHHKHLDPRPRSPDPDPDAPPPLPSVPPPPLNWNTFPGGQGQDAPDHPGFVPEAGGPDSQGLNGEVAKRMGILKRKSDFLGVNYRETEEYRKLIEESRSRAKEDEEWQRIESQEHLSTSALLSRFDKMAASPQASPRQRAARPHEDPSNLSSDFDLEQREKEIVQNLEREEKERQRREDEIRMRREELERQETERREEQRYMEDQRKQRERDLERERDAQRERDVQRQRQEQREREQEEQQRERDLKRQQDLQRERELQRELEVLRERERELEQKRREDERERLDKERAMVRAQQQLEEDEQKRRRDMDELRENKQREHERLMEERRRQIAEQEELLRYKAEGKQRLLEERAGTKLDYLRRAEEEAENQRSRESHERMRSWKSMEYIKHANVQPRLAHSIEHPLTSQEQFQRDQERLQQQKQNDLKKAEESELENKRQEEKLLEKELAKQHQLEEIRRVRDAGRLKEEEERKKEEKREHDRQRVERLADTAQRDIRSSASWASPTDANKWSTREKLRIGVNSSAAAADEELRAEERELARRQREEEERQRRAQEERDRRARVEEDDRLRREQEEDELRQRRAQEQERRSADRERTRDGSQPRRPDSATYRTGEVARTFAERQDSRKGDFEYVYQSEAEGVQGDLGDVQVPPPLQFQEPTPGGGGGGAAVDRTELYRVEPPAPATARPQTRPPEPPAPAAAPPQTQTQKPLKTEPPIPAKPNIKMELQSNRRDIIEMNKRPSGLVQPDRHNRKSWSPDEQYLIRQKDSYDKPMSRDEVIAITRKSGVPVESSSPRPAAPASPASSTASAPPQPLTRRNLNNLGAAPGRRLMDSQDWIRPEEERRGQRRSDVMRQQLGSSADHWLVEEAERRRVADQTGQVRPQALPDRQDPGQAEQGYPPPPSHQSLSQSQHPHPHPHPHHQHPHPQGHPLDYQYPGGYGEQMWQRPPNPPAYRPSPPASLDGLRPGGHPPPGDPRDQASYTSYSHSPQPSMSTFRPPGGSPPEGYAPHPQHAPHGGDPARQALLDRVSGSPRGSQSPTPASYPTPSHYPQGHGSSQPHRPHPNPDHHYPPQSSPPRQHHHGHHQYSPPQRHHDNQYPPPQYTSPQYAQPRVPYGDQGYSSYPGDHQHHHHHHQQQQQQQPPPPQHAPPSSHHGLHHPGSSPSSSAHSSAPPHESAPPVPPKPPRLLSSSSEESHAEPVVSLV